MSYGELAVWYYFVRIEAKNAWIPACRAHFLGDDGKYLRELSEAKVILSLDLQEAGRLPPICMHTGHKRAHFGVFGKSLMPNHLVIPGGLMALWLAGKGCSACASMACMREVAVLGSDQSDQSVQPRKTAGLRRTDIQKTGRTKSVQALTNHMAGVRVVRPGPTSKWVVGTLKTAEIRHCTDRTERTDLFFEDAGTDRIEALLLVVTGYAVLGSQVVAVPLHQVPLINKATPNFSGVEARAYFLFPDPSGYEVGPRPIVPTSK